MSPDKTFQNNVSKLIAVLAAILVFAVTLELLTLDPHTVAPRITPTIDSGIGPDTSVPNGTPEGSAQPTEATIQVTGGGGYGASDPFVSLAGIQRKNPWTPAEAAAFAKAEVNHPTRNWKNLCEGSTAWFYGWGGSGYYSAKAHAYDVPSRLRHSVKKTGGEYKNIPIGALVYFPVGTYGHVVMVTGYTKNGSVKVSSNDVYRSGRIDIVKLSWFPSHWGMTPAFWAPPNFPPAFGRNPNPRPKINTSKPVSTPVTVKPAPKPVARRSGGPDVSSYQGKVVWNNVAKSLIKGSPKGTLKTRFAFAKATEGNWVDPTFKRNWGLMRKLPARGAYDFATFSRSPKADAKRFVNVVKTNGGFRKKGDFAVIDAEGSNSLSKARMERWLRVWVASVKSRSGLPTSRIVVYTGGWWTGSNLSNAALKRFGKSGVRLWLSDYAKHPKSGLYGWSASWVQYTDSAHVPGVRGRSDASYWVGKGTLRKAAGVS